MRATSNNFCAFCQKEVEVGDRVGRGEACPSCGRDLHCCYQCHFYDPSAYNECREPQADRVVEKDRANFCDYFQFNPKIRVGATKADDLKGKWEKMFKK